MFHIHLRAVSSQPINTRLHSMAFMKKKRPTPMQWAYDFNDWLMREDMKIMDKNIRSFGLSLVRFKIIVVIIAMLIVIRIIYVFSPAIADLLLAAFIVAFVAWAIWLIVQIINELRTLAE